MAKTAIGSIHQIVQNLPEEGEWLNDDNQTPLLELGLLLHQHGLSIEEIRAILRKLYQSIANEFGG